ncbi:MAG: hypothetical protein KDJ72_13110 [Methyloceanibacter sp.]|uniref:hypothetical protein n=1 Tax=Methyloceanibacter sp. TaxID=1965321 RepID=UPI001D54AB9D|nr:hypothetical protein [Methyloceanibacter sp.]MCB1443952.1 hypothetical protein [Methyloceanibacter sp.]
MLGFLVTASTVISLLQRGFDISLVFSLDRLLEYYRELVKPFYAILHVPWQWVFRQFDSVLPSWFQDAHTLSFICAAISMRAFTLGRFEGEEDKFPTVAHRLGGAFFGGYTFLSLVLLPGILFSMLLLPVGFFNHYRWSGTTEGLLQNMLDIAAENSTLDNLLMGIFGWFTLFSVTAFFVVNTVLK